MTPREVDGDRDHDCVRGDDGHQPGHPAFLHELKRLDTSVQMASPITAFGVLADGKPRTAKSDVINYLIVPAVIGGSLAVGCWLLWKLAVRLVGL